MAILALLVEKPFWQDVFNELAKRGVFVTHVSAKFHPDVSTMSYFKNHKIKAVDSMNFFKLSKIFELTKKNTTVLDKKIINYFESVERDFYLLTERFNYVPRSFRYRKRLFRENIRFWLSYLTEEKIELVFISCTPHDLPSFMAYHAAKYLGIPTWQYGHTMINDYVTCEADYRTEFKAPEDYLAGLNVDQVMAHIPEKLRVRSLAENKFLEYSKFLNVQAMTNKHKIHMEDSSFTRNRVAIDEVAYMGLSDFRKENNLLFMDDKVGGYLRKFLKKYDRRRIAKLKESYTALTTPPDYAEKFIYYSMHMQPERTATPEAEIFEDQLMAIDILSKSLPEGWKVYVKEHPSQFHRKMNLFKGINTRDLSDYEDILRCKNVQLISCEISSKELIEHAQMVATLSGSVGWETLQAQKTCITFANSWYNASQSVQRVSNVVECKAAIAKLRTHTPEIVYLNTLKYLAYMSDKMIIGNLGDESFVDAITVPYEEHVNSVADNIQQQYQAAQR